MLGGNLQNLYYVAEGYNPHRLGRDLINRVRAHPRIQVHTRTELVQHTGHVGNFPVRSAHHPCRMALLDTFQIEHGVTIVATGGRETREHPWLDLPHVITQRELEEKIIHHPEEIAALKDVVMIQCVHAARCAGTTARGCAAPTR